MRRWLAAPQAQNPYETFAAHALHYTLLLLLSVAIIFVFFTSSLSQLIFIPVMVGVVFVCYCLLHIGRLSLASMIFLSGLWLVITIAAFSINGIRNAAISSYAIVIIFSAVLFTNRAVMAFTALSILSVVVLAVGEMWGVLPLQTTPLYLADRLFQHVALFGAAGILLFAASRVIRTSFLRVRENEELLVERNRALEAEIAERQHAEAVLRVSEARYRLLFENIPVMASIYGSDGEVVLVNKASAKALGGTPESLKGRNMRELVSPEDAEIAIRIQKQVMTEGKAHISEGTVTLRQEYDMYYLNHVMPLPDLDGNSTSQVLSLTTDLTEKQRAEQREQELARARERNQLLTDFFGMVSHDLKTPLTVMTTSLYLLQRARTEEQREAKITSISQQIALMDRYIQDMLTIARLEHLPLYDFQSLDLNRLIDSVVRMLRPQIENKQIQCQFHKQADLPAIWGDDEQIQRMLMNLLENAVNYSPAGGKVTVKTQLVNDCVRLEVTDSGIGIEPEAIPHIFERFFRTSRARASYNGGTGLGLSIVKKIADMHVATIEVSSELNKGTKFFVQFPDERPAQG